MKGKGVKGGRGETHRNVFFRVGGATLRSCTQLRSWSAQRGTAALQNAAIHHALQCDCTQPALGRRPASPRRK